MVRRGWTHVEVPSGWVRVLRGPRPPSVQWPQARSVSKVQQERRSSAVPPVGKGSGKGVPRQKERDSAPLPRRTPEMNRTAAVAKISGDDDSEEVDVLKRALEKAQMQARTPPAETQIAQAIQFIERAKKRLAGADEKIRQAAEVLRQAEFEKAADIQAVAEAEAQVERLRAQSAQPPPNPSPTPMQGVPVSMEAEVERLRAQVAQLQGQVQDTPAAKRRAVGSGRAVSAMPNTLIPGEVSAWVEECHSLMLDAVNVGDRNRVLELSNLIAAGVERVTELTSPQH